MLPPEAPASGSDHDSYTDDLTRPDTVDRHARASKAAGDPRPIGLLRAGALADLLLRPWDTSREPVTAHLTVVAPLDALAPHVFLTGGTPTPASLARPAPIAEVDGEPITAAHVRELLTQLDALCPGGLQAPAGGTLTIAITDADGALKATATRRWSGSPAAAAPSIPMFHVDPAAARCSPRPPRSTATGPARRSGGS